MTEFPGRSRRRRLMGAWANREKLQQQIARDFHEDLRRFGSCAEFWIFVQCSYLVFKFLLRALRFTQVCPIYITFSPFCQNFSQYTERKAKCRFHRLFF
jgi:hypothetical protein